MQVVYIKYCSLNIYITNYKVTYGPTPQNRKQNSKFWINYCTIKIM